MEKKGQVTIFIIIAIVIVALGVTAYFLFPKLQSALGRGVTNPEEFIQTCLEEEIEDAVELVSLQGGSIEPEHVVNYNGEEIEYLCYTNRYFVLCSVEQPFLKKHIESEIKNEIDSVVWDCFSSLQNSYERRGYDVGGLDDITIKIELLPKRVVAIIDTDLTLTKEDTERYDSFNVVLNNNLYELVGIANSIIEKETVSGSIELIIYRNIYEEIDFRMDWTGDGTKVYILTERKSGNSFRFASRSLVHSPGIGEIPGIEEV